MPAMNYYMHEILISLYKEYKCCLDVSKQVKEKMVFLNNEVTQH